MARGQNNNDNRNLEEADSNSHGWLWGFKEVTADIVETARELEFEVEPKDVTELLWFHEKTWMNEELLLMHEQRKWFPEKEYAPGEESVKSVETTANDLEYCRNLVDKATAGFKRISSSFERSSLWVKCYQTTLHAIEKSFMLVYCCSNLQQPQPCSVNSHQHWDKTLQQQEGYDSLMAWTIVSIF